MVKFQTEKKDRFVIIPVAVIFFLSIIVSLLDFFTFHDMTFKLNVITLLGLVLFLIGIIIRRIGKWTLGKYYSYGLRTIEDHKLISHGIYKYARHPIGFAAIVYSIGIPLIFSSFIGFALMLIIIPFILYRVKIEERMLTKKFGEEYREYMKITKKLIPFIY